MIRAVTWFCAEHYGVFMPDGASWQNPSPKVSVASDVLALVGRPVNYYSRMTTEARYCLCAASVAMGAIQSQGEIGLLSGGCEGWVAANQEYFRDYVAEGRSLGRGNLFIYTLSTSVLGELAIVLSLAGPCLFVRDMDQPVAGLIRCAEQLIEDREAGAMLALWSDTEAAICFAIEAGPDNSQWPTKLETNPLELARELQRKVHRT